MEQLTGRGALPAVWLLLGAAVVALLLGGCEGDEPARVSEEQLEGGAGRVVVGDTTYEFSASQCIVDGRIIISGPGEAPDGDPVFVEATLTEDGTARIDVTVEQAPGAEQRERVWWRAGPTIEGSEPGEFEVDGRTVRASEAVFVDALDDAAEPREGSLVARCPEPSG
jgi:hypothetical protein